MNYEKIYNDLIQKRKDHQLIKLKKDDPNYIYCERHHIVPVSCHGTNDNLNTINLLPKEHYIAHLLLLKIYEIEDPNLQAMAFLCLMHQCINNTSLFKYLFFMKSKGEKLSDGDRFLQSGLKMINRSEHNDEYMELYTKIRSSLKKEENILNYFKGFVGNYSIVNFVKQEIELVSNDQGIIIVQIKYFTTITENKISQIVVPKNNNPQYPVKDEEKSKNGTNYYFLFSKV